MILIPEVPFELDEVVQRMHQALAEVFDIAARYVDDGAAVAPAYRWLVFRVAQEALRNVVQHSKAAKVHVELRRAESGTVLVVEDNVDSAESLWMLLDLSISCLMRIHLAKR